MKHLRHSALPGIAAAAVLHGGLLALLFLSDPPEPRAAVRKPPVRVRVIERRPPRPQPAAETEVKPAPKTRPEKKKSRKRSKPIDRPVLVKALPAEPAPVTPTPVDRAEPAPITSKPAATAEAQPRKPRRFSVAMSGTVASGGVAVPTTSSGVGWAFGSSDGDPDGERSLAGPAPAAPGNGEGILPRGATAVTALPRLVAQPSFREMRELYPELARADGLEADVALKILVSTRGEVVKIRMLRRAGQGFDEAAEKLVKRFRFAPGRQGAEPVAVWIPWTYRFRLEG